MEIKFEHQFSKNNKNNRNNKNVKTWHRFSHSKTISGIRVINTNYEVMWYLPTNQLASFPVGHRITRTQTSRGKK